jgi:hypothetical protein
MIKSIIFPKNYEFLSLPFARLREETGNNAESQAFSIYFRLIISLLNSKIYVEPPFFSRFSPGKLGDRLGCISQ